MQIKVLKEGKWVTEEWVEQDPWVNYKKDVEAIDFDQRFTLFSTQKAGSGMSYGGGLTDMLNEWKEEIRLSQIVKRCLGELKEVEE